MRRLFRSHPVATGILALSLAVMLFFAVRLAVGAIYWSQHRAEPLAGWMTVRYVGRSWDVDPRAIFDLTGYPRPEGRAMTLEDIAAAQGVPVAEVIAAVEAAVTRLRTEAATDGAAP